MQEQQLEAALQQRSLKELYQASKLPNKPRNPLGFAKDLPPAEMRALLLGGYTVTAEQVRELALQRSMAVRDALMAKGVPNSRIFMAAPAQRRRVTGGLDPRRAVSCRAPLFLPHRHPSQSSNP